MRKKSFFDIFIVGAGNGINAILGLLFFTAIARTLSIEDFGRYALLTSLLVSLSKIMDFGTNSQYVAKSIAKPEHYLNRFFTLKVILFFVTALIGASSLYLLKLSSLQTLCIFLFGTLGYGINITLFAYFQRVEMFVHAVLLNTIPALIKATLAISIFLGFYQPNLTQAFSVFSLSILSSSLLLYWLPKHFLKARFSKTGVREFFGETLPAGISHVVTTGWPAISNTIVKITNTFTGVGIFSLAQKIADIFSLISQSVFTVLLPKNAHRKKLHQAYDIKETVILAGGILTLALGAMVVANYFTVPIFGEKFTGSLDLLNILILAAAISAIHSFMDNFFFVEEKITTLMKISLSKLVVFILGAFVLIPTYALKGLATANLISSILALILVGTSIRSSR